MKTMFNNKNSKENIQNLNFKTSFKTIKKYILILIICIIIVFNIMNLFSMKTLKIINKQQAILSIFRINIRKVKYLLKIQKKVLFIIKLSNIFRKD